MFSPGAAGHGKASGNTAATIMRVRGPSIPRRHAQQGARADVLRKTFAP